MLMNSLRLHLYYPNYLGDLATVQIDPSIRRQEPGYSRKPWMRPHTPKATLSPLSSESGQASPSLSPSIPATERKQAAHVTRTEPSLLTNPS